MDLGAEKKRVRGRLGKWGKELKASEEWNKKINSICEMASQAGEI